VKRRKVVDVVSDLLMPFLPGQGMELVDVEFVKEGQHRYLRIFIDKEGGISLEDCQKVSEYLNEKLDSTDPIEENYFMEVSSPGVERVLKKDADFERFKEQLVEVKLYFPLEGTKIIEGTLKGLKDGKVAVQPENSAKILEIPKDKISLVKLLVRF
jgi:ribosome maturation factor RimP